MINTVTLNPALDQLLYVEKFEKNITSRVRETALTIGGKGTHVSLGLKILGESSNTFGICHGETGQKVIDMLKASGLNVFYYHKPEPETRTNYLLIEDTGDCTIIAQKGAAVPPQDINSLIQIMAAVINPGDLLILSGDASNSPEPFVYNHIIRELSGKSLKILLDTSGPSLLESLKASPYLIKPNLSELSFLCGQEIEETDSSIIAAIDSLTEYNIPIIAVSLGEKGSLVKTPEGIYRACPPRVKAINTIGCGDCFLAGYAYGIIHQLSCEETIRTATAVSAATAESNSSVGYDLKRAKELMPLVRIQKIHSLF